MLGLLPNALVAVAASERADYAAAVPAKQLITHPDLPSLMAIRNWLADTIQEDCLVQVDDDLACIRPMIGKQRAVKCPERIAAVIENSQVVSRDLGINVFCWSRSPNTAISHPELLPVRFVQPISSSFGIRGAARRRRFDEQLVGRADLDFTMQTLLEDRIVYADMRWYFDHGRIFAGKGGNVGLVGSEAFAQTTAELYRRWDRFLGRNKKRMPWFKSAAGSSSPMSIKVKRMNPLAR